MREIKFRAWDKTSNSMIIEYAKIGSYGELYVSSFHISAYNKNGSPDLILLQYTGLKDKNGKEIYEGDIIKCLYEYYDLEDDEQAEIFKVEYMELKNCGCCFRDTGRGFNFYGYESGKEIEIIGNIYENPELLEGEDENS